MRLGLAPIYNPDFDLRIPYWYSYDPGGWWTDPWGGGGGGGGGYPVDDPLIYSINGGGVPTTPNLPTNPVPPTFRVNTWTVAPGEEVPWWLWLLLAAAAYQAFRKKKS